MAQESTSDRTGSGLASLLTSWDSALDEVGKEIDGALRDCLVSGPAADAMMDFVQRYQKKHSRRFVDTARFVLGHEVPGGCLRQCDIGIGAGELALLLRKLAGWIVTGLDTTLPMSAMLQATGYYSALGVEFRVCDLAREALPFPDDSFDVVTFFETLEHLNADPPEVLQRIKRTMKPGGLLFITTPNFASLRNRAALFAGINPTKWWPPPGDPYGAHIREYTMGEVEAFLVHSGFTIVNKRFSCPLTRTYDAHPLLKSTYLALVQLRPSLRETLMLSARKS